MSKIEFWVKNIGDSFVDFSEKIPSDGGVSFFSGQDPTSHSINSYNDSTAFFDGSSVQKLVNNVKFTHPSSGETFGFYEDYSLISPVGPKGSEEEDFLSKRALNLLSIPNNASTLNIKFVGASPVNTQNPSVIIAKSPTGSITPENVDFKVAHIMHPETSSVGQIGSGDSSWTSFPSDSIVSNKYLNDNPGHSGISTGVSSTIHDWYIALSGKSLDIDPQNFYLTFSVEYL
jgi:hypothetical protein